MEPESTMSRKEFLRTSALGTAGMALAGTIGAPAILKSASPNDAIGVGVVGLFMALYRLEGTASPSGRRCGRW